VLFALFTCRAFLWLIFREGDDLRVLSPNNLGDMSLHLTFIQYLANGAPFWPDSPIFAQGKLAYSVGTDLFNSLLTLVGVDVVRGLIWVGLVGSTLAGMALWKWGRGFALLGFLCSGGLLGIAAFSRPAGEPFFQDYPGLLVFDWAWKSLPLALLVTQRGFLFALPAGLLLLASWRTRFLGGGQGWRMPVWCEWLLYASMPVFHAHSFIALSFVLGCWLISQGSARRKIVTLIAAAFIPATVLLYLTIGMLRANASSVLAPDNRVDAAAPPNVLGWQPGWMVNEPLERFDPWPLVSADIPKAEQFEGHGRFLLFWLGNFGMLPFFAGALAFVLLQRMRGKPIGLHWPLLFVAVFVGVTPYFGRDPWSRINALPLIFATVAVCFLLWRISRSKSPEASAAAFVFPGLYLFFLCCNVKFAPSPWDNTKLMLWGYLLVLPFLWEYLIARWRPWQRAVVLVILFFSGFVTLIGGLNRQYEGYSIAQLSELVDVREATAGIPITETFAAAPAYNHPLLLSGRKVLIGYEAHLWSHGISYGVQEALLTGLMHGGNDWGSYAERLGIRYLFFGRNESERWPESRKSWRKDARLVSSGDWGELYDLKSKPDVTEPKVLLQ
jgi:hypothetical protein